jgi:ATP-dependent exoDNAse (exonuclease V) alpha subunit
MRKKQENAAVVAPTGIAAINCGGRTIHSFFGFRPGITESEIEDTFLTRRPPKVVQKLKTLIIDEISMVRADLLDCVNLYLRYVKLKAKPFGGVRVIMVGDPLQLPPVVKEDEKEALSNLYESEYFYSSKVFNEIKPNLTLIELNEVFRQEDPEFISLLDRIRLGKASLDDLKLLNSKVVDYEELPEHTIILSPYKNRVTDLNMQKLKEIKAKEYEFKAEIWGDIKENQYPAEVNLVVKKGAQVVMLNNDPEKRWVNGSIGTIEEIGKDEDPYIAVRFDEDEYYYVERYRWEVYRYYWDEKEEKIKSEVIGTFEQFPLKPAWALTIHKSQGMTFDRVAIDLDRGTFAPGQFYVALSRARSLNGIYLLSPVFMSDIKVDWKNLKLFEQSY